jgi:hypothetical protein
MVSIGTGPPKAGAKTADGRTGSGSVVHGPTVVVVDASMVLVEGTVAVVSGGTVGEIEVYAGTGSVGP